MRAVTLSEVPGALEVGEAEVPAPGPGELLVRVAASSVNGFDLGTAAGYLQGRMEHRFPLIPGKDFAGDVAAVGPDVEGYTVGETVFGVDAKPFLGAGSHAEFVTVPTAAGVARVPQGVSVSDAGALGVAGCAALASLSALGPLEGKTVLVSGATGGVGALFVQLAAAQGARVLATAKPGHETDFLTQLIAPAMSTSGPAESTVHVVDYTADLAAQVRNLAPHRVDAVLHLAGDLAELTALARPGGTVASTITTREAPAGADLHTVMVTANPSAENLTTLADHVALGRLQVPITATYRLAETPQAYAAFAAGAVGKIALAVD
jgi:NADPH:quinone reductase-like Zn-dependent oxidoreductase